MLQLKVVQQLIKSYDNQTIYRENGNSYLVLPLTDHIGATNPTVLREAVNAICDVAKWFDKVEINKIVSEEEKGGFIAVAVALQRNLPFTLAKQNPVRLPGEIGIKFKMDYSDKMSLYLNGVNSGDKILIIEDIIATGGTMIAMIQAIRQAGAEIVDIVALAEKVELGGVKKIFDQTGFLVKTILKLDCTGEKSRVVGVHSL